MQDLLYKIKYDCKRYAKKICSAENPHSLLTTLDGLTAPDEVAAAIIYRQLYYI